MTRRSLTAVLAALLAPTEIPMSQDTAPARLAEDGAWAAVDLRALAARGEEWIEVLDVPTLSAGLYRLPRGGRDGQSPHELDEVYAVVSGRATLEVGEGEQIERLAAGPGSLLFVRAGVPHRFVDIEEDLSVLVVFSKARPGTER